MPDAPSGEQTISLPSILIFAVLSFLAFRYFFSSSSTTTSSTGTYPARTHRQVPYDKIATITAMFPQLRPRDVEYDLLRNGASVQDTSERVLREGRLASAPPSFQAQTPPPTALSSSSSSSSSQARTAPASSSSSSSSSPQQHKHTDLITRYNLGSRVRKGKDALFTVSADGTEPAKSNVAGNTGKGKEPDTQTTAIQTSSQQREKGAWSSSKTERQALLRRRREDMVLAARRRMEEKEQERTGERA